MINNQDQESDDGYDSDLFENPEKAAEFKCPICTCIAKDPIETEPCGHLYCKGCLQSHLSVKSISDLNKEPSYCPSCREPIQETSRSKFVERQILKLRVKCCNYQCGCSWKGDLNHFKQHLAQECQFVSITCTHCTLTQYLRGKEEEHLNECTEYPVECELCQSKVKRKLITNHMETLCPSLLLSCPNQCGINIKQSLLSKHIDKDCVHRRINCVYRCYGCSVTPRYNDVKLHLTQHQMVHLELKVMYLERLAQSTELISVSNATGLYPEISGLYEREQEPYLARPVWRNRNNKIYLIRYDDALTGWVLDKKGFDRDIIALRMGKYPTATANKPDPQHILDLEQMLLCHDDDENVSNIHDINDEKMDNDDDKQNEDDIKIFKKKRRGLFCDGIWHIKGNVENSRIKVKGYTEREFDLEWELASFAAKMRRQRSGIHNVTTVTNVNANHNKVIGCVCGKGLMTRKDNPYNNNAEWNAICNVCDRKVLSGIEFWHCSSKRSMQHIDGYDLCLSCGEARRQTQDLNAPTCDCGSKLLAMMSFSAYGHCHAITCNVCRGTVDGVIWHCNKDYNKAHEKGFDLCINCGKTYTSKKAGLMSWWSK